MKTSQVIRSLAILLCLTVTGSLGNEGQVPSSDVGLVPEHHQPNADGTVTDLGPQQFHTPNGMPPQQQQPQQAGPNGPAYGPRPGFGSEPQQAAGMPFSPNMGPQQMMMPGGGAAYGAPPQFGGYGAGMNGGYRQAAGLAPGGMYNAPPMQSPPGFNGPMMGGMMSPQQQQPAFNPASAAGLAAQFVGPQAGPAVDPMMGMVSGKMMYAGVPAMNPSAAGSPSAQQQSAAGEFRGLDASPYYRRR